MLLFILITDFFDEQAMKQKQILLYLDNSGEVKVVEV